MIRGEYQEMRDNPDQAIVDAELAKFNQQWFKEHPRCLTGDDSSRAMDGPDLDADPGVAGAMNQGGLSAAASKDLYFRLKREYRNDYLHTKKAFIRTNPVIQGVLAREVQRKANEIRQRYAQSIAAAAVMRQSLGLRRAP